VNAVIEYTHRFVAALTTPLILAAAWVSWRRARTIRWLVRPLLVAIPFLAAVIVFGAFAVLTGLARPVAALDLSSALVTLTLVVTAAVVASARHADPALPDRFSARSGLARLSLAALAAIFLLYVSGILVAGRGSLTRCVGWPFWRLIPDDLAGGPQVARLLLAAVTVLLIAWLVVRTWRTRPAHPAQRRAAAVAGLAFIIEMAVGLIMQLSGSTMPLLMAYVAAGTLLYAALVALAARAGLVGEG
jgi:cytochrome c oxidase assembly protein subunit 15